MESMTQVPWLDDHQQRVWRAWLQVNGRLTAQMQRNMQADAGLSLPDFEVLVMLTDVESGSVRVSDLARGLQWERSRLSHHLTRMEKRGLVARAECVEDGRGAIVLLTPQGRTAIEAAAPAHVRTVRQLFIDRLDEADLAALNRITDKLLEGLPPQG